MDPETLVLDHVTIGVTNIEASKQFYDQALHPLGIECLFTDGDFAGYGADEICFLWIGRRDQPQTGSHIAFAAPDRATVDKFHQAARAAGGRDNGPPGLRPYQETYYAAFILDPDGHNIEAVCHNAEP